MSSILNSIMANMHVIKVLLDDASQKIVHKKRTSNIEHILVQNTVDESSANAGVKIQKIYDEYNDFIQDEKRKTSAQVANEQEKIEAYSQLESLFGEKSTIFSTLVNKLFSSIKENDTTNENVFNVQIENNLKNIIFELKNFDDKLSNLEKNIKELIEDKIRQANILINKIYEISIDIRYFPVQQLPGRVNSYLDKREELIDKLNNIIGVKVVKNDDEFKVCLNNGLCLIDNHKKHNLIALTSNLDKKCISVGYRDNNNQLHKIEHMISSSSLGALFEFRKGDLENARNKIGQLTINLTDSIKHYTTIGYDMLGNLGKQVFHISNPNVISSSTNKSYPFVSVKWINTNDAQDTNYLICLKNNRWIVTRLKDHEIIQPEIYQENDSTFMLFDGIEFRIDSNNNTEGDMYMIKPYSDTLSKLTLSVVENNPLSTSSNNNSIQMNRNVGITTKNLNQDTVVDPTEVLFASYRKFFKHLSYISNDLEEKIPFKKNMIKILDNKKLSTLDDNHQDYQKLSYEQKCYLANAKILKLAETIFNEIIECYSE